MCRKKRALICCAAIVASIKSASAVPMLTVIGSNVAAYENETLSVDGAGDVYYGGAAVFELPANKRQQTLVTSLKTGGVVTSITADSAGNLFVGTSAGGTYNDGVVAELSGPNYQTQTTVTTFNTGTDDNTTTLLYSGGSLYGTTNPVAGTAGPEIFKISGAGYTTFASAPIRASYSDGVVADTAGNVYYTGLIGNSPGYEALLKVPASFNYNQGQQILHTFNTSISAISPGGPLAIDSAGNLYALAASGSSAYGCVIEMQAPDYQSVNVLANLNSSTGSGSYGGLIIDSAGDLFGTSSTGGAYGQGDVFELSGPNDQTVSIVASYKSSDKTVPWNTLSVDGAGNLYGIAFDGVQTSDIFEITDSGYVVVPEPSWLSILALGAIGLSRRPRPR